MTEKELAAVKKLANLCNQYEGIELKLNYTTLEQRPEGENSDFFYYVDGEMKAFLALYAFNTHEAEICGMVHPDYRRQGIFRNLLEQGIAELQRRGIPEILLVIDNRSTSGVAFAKAVGATYKVSEHKMHLMGQPSVQPQRFEDLHVVRATIEEAEFIRDCTSRAFHIQDMLPTAPEKFQQANRRIYVIRKGSEPVGTLQATLVDGISSTIYGFCMLPEEQGKGYGRQALSTVMQELYQDGYTAQDLEVAAENDRALALYQDCGFVQTFAIDYYVRNI